MRETLQTKVGLTAEEIAALSKENTFMVDDTSMATYIYNNDEKQLENITENHFLDK